MADICKFKIEPEIINLHNEIDAKGDYQPNFQMKIESPGHVKFEEKMYGKFIMSKEEY